MLFSSVLTTNLTDNFENQLMQNGKATGCKVDRLVNVLLSHRGIFLNQEKFLKKLEISSKGLLRLFSQVRQEGLCLEEVTGRGWRLKRLPDWLLGSMVQPHLRSTYFGQRIHHYFRVGSTNEIAHQLALEGVPEGTVVVAEEQIHGRGRLGRSWLSQKGRDIILSLVLRPSLSPCEVSCLNLVVGLAASKAIRAVSGLATDLKWPNDVLVRKKKCCGILTEMNAQSDHIDYLIVGLGINVNGISVPKVIADKASTLRRESGRLLPRNILVAEFLYYLESLYLNFLRNGMQALLDDWIENSSYATGKQVKIQQLGRCVQGITMGLNRQGVLFIRRVDGQIEKVMTGDLVQW